MQERRGRGRGREGSGATVEGGGGAQNKSEIRIPSYRSETGKASASARRANITLIFIITTMTDHWGQLGGSLLWIAIYSIFLFTTIVAVAIAIAAPQILPHDLGEQQANRNQESQKRDNNEALFFPHKTAQIVHESASSPLSLGREDEGGEILAAAWVRTESPDCL